MKEIFERGATSVILHVIILDSSSTTGGRKTGLAYNTASLACSKIRSGETLSTVTIEDITTLGTYQAPTSNAHIRFKEVHSTNWPGLYEVHLHNDWLDTTNSRRNLKFNFFGASGMVPTPVEVQLSDPVRGVGSPTALPNAAAEAAGGLYTRGTGAGQINQANNGQIDANAARLGGTTQTGRDVGASVLLSSGTGTGQVKLSSGYVAPNWGDVGNPTTTNNLSGTTVATVTTLTGHTPQTGDAYARLGAPIGASISADALSRFQKLARYLWLMMRKDAAIATDFATELLEINADNGSGLGAWTNTTDSQEARRDNVGTAGAGLTSLPAVTVGAINAAGVQDLFTVDSGATNGSAVDGSLVAETAKKVWNSSTSGWFFGTMGELFGTFSTTLTNVAARIGNWTGSGRNTILGAFQALFRKDADASVPSDVNADLGSGAGGASNTTDSLEAQRDNVGTAGAGLTAADDTTLAAIAALNNLSSAQAQTAAAAALATYDPPTHAELTAALAGADDAVLAAIAALNNLSAAQVWDLANAIETGETPRQVLRLLRAVIAGVSAADDPEAGTVVFKRKDGTTTALTVVYNATADRTTVTVGDLS